MNDQHVFGDLIPPAVFRRTRFLPAKISSRLISDILDTISTDNCSPTILDIGCGCGRLLEGLELSGKEFSATGIDISQNMLNAASPLVQQSKSIELQVGDCRQASLFMPRSFDLILMHWVLNATDGWEDIVKNASSWVKGHGVIAWFQEESNLYDAIDGHALSYSNNGWSEFETEVWNQWYNVLGGNEAEFTLGSRLGLPMKSSQSEKELLKAGFQIDRLHYASQTWSKEVNIHCIIEEVIANRAFSNLWRISDRQYEKSVNAVKSYISRYNDSETVRSTIHYRSVPIIARNSSWMMTH